MEQKLAEYNSASRVEVFLFHSWPLAIWVGLFFLIHAIYFPLYEEKGLEERFGEEYQKYKASVRGWIPKLKP